MFSILRRLTPNHWMLIAIVLGVGCGLANIELINTMSAVVSKAFLRFLKLISLPLLFFAVISAITQMEHFDTVKRIGRHFLRYTLMTTLIAAFIAWGLYLIIHPHAALGAPLEPLPAAVQAHGYFEFLWTIIPDNIVNIFADNQVLGGASLGLLLGLVSLNIPHEHKEPIQRFFQHGFALVLQLAQLIIKVIPFGIWAFVTQLVLELAGDNDTLSLLAVYVGCVIAANLIQGFIVLPLLLKSKGISPLKAAKGMWPALSLAFFSKSSNIAMPMTMRCAQENMGVKPSIAKSGIPLCTVFNMNGCAAFILITLLFVAEYHGLSFSLSEQLLWVLIASLAAIGNAGVPMGCFFLTSALLVGLGVPLSLMGMILPVYAVIDMIETTLNVWSDSCICLIVDKELKK